MKKASEFPHKLNEFIEEEVEIPSFTPVVNEEKKRVEFKQSTQKVTRKTMYVHSVPNKVICNNHKFVCLDKGKYLFKCVRCSWHQIAPPHRYKFNPKTGVLSLRNTGIRV